MLARSVPKVKSSTDQQLGMKLAFSIDQALRLASLVQVACLVLALDGSTAVAVIRDEFPISSGRLD